MESDVLSTFIANEETKWRFFLQYPVAESQECTLHDGKS
jgi:hypothetical protein